MNFKRILSAVMLVAFAGCSSTTMIRSSDPNSKIYVDGELMGTGQVSHTDKKIVGSTTTVRIEKPGCAPQSYSFIRSEEFDVGACIGGVFVLVPFLWVMKYKPERTYEYTCTKVR